MNAANVFLVVLTVETIGGKEVTHTGYTMTVVMFVALGIVGFMLAVALKRVEAHRTRGLSIEAVLHE